MARSVLAAMDAAGGIPKEERWGHGDALPQGCNYGKNPDCTVADPAKSRVCGCHGGRLRAVVRVGGVDGNTVMEEFCSKSQATNKYVIRGSGLQALLPDGKVIEVGGLRWRFKYSDVPLSMGYRTSNGGQRRRY